MPQSGVSDSKRILTCAAGFVLLAGVLFFNIYIAVESAHDCTGSSCPVCACIQHCKNILGQIGESAAARFSALAPVFFVLLHGLLSACRIMGDTLVSKKVRLNN